ncbi:hypothetical protein D3C71_2010580 [compost metagenome]
MQEKECQRNFNHNKLQNIANTNFSAVETHQPGERKNNDQRQQEMNKVIHFEFSAGKRSAYLAIGHGNRKWAFTL